jgi:large repetitive protein
MVNPNVICASYGGLYLFNTSSTSTGGKATVVLTYTLSGATAGCNSLTGLSKTDFIMNASGDNGIGAIPTPTYGYDPVSHVLTITYTDLPLQTSAYSGTILFQLQSANINKVVLDGTCVDEPLITISTKADGFVTGGGYIVPTNATGDIGLLANGWKNNFGFNVKYNKGGTNLQGNWNFIIRNGAKLYQIKSSQPKTLTVGQISATSYRADIMFSAANIKELTTGSGYGTGTVNVTVFDNGEPGAGVDQIFIKVTDGSKNWYFSSSTADITKPTTVTYLTQGNIQIHTLGAKAAVTTSRDVQTTTTVAQTFQVTATPNPTFSSFNLNITGNNASGLVNVKVTDILGRVVEAKQNLAPGQTLRIGSEYKPGVYIVQVMQGDTVKQLKLVKQ